MKKILTPFNILIILFIASFSTAMALEAGGQKDQLIADFERAKAFTTEYMAAMPEDGFEYKPTADIRSFAQQYLHIAGANYMFSSMLAEIENPKNGVEFEKNEELYSKAACMKAVAESFDFAIETLKGMSEEDLDSTIKLFNQFEMTKATGFSKAFEHITHHRGQTTIYLRLKGINPPSEMLF
jgi:uncharacterized damage-inducible protein DinB